MEQMGALPLPRALLECITSGRWRPPASAETIRQVFGDEPEWPQFYDLPTIARQNRLFHEAKDADLEEFAGSSEGLGLDPDQAVLIGSLGMDMPIVLDYRLSRGQPRVIYLGNEGWREVAPNVETLVHRLGL